MDPDRLRVLLAAPLASLFLVLSLCAFVVERPVSTGIDIPMIRIHRDPNRALDCGSRAIFMRLTADGKSWMNETEIPTNQIESTIAAKMENRAEKIVYVFVDSELSYGQFMWFTNKLSRAVPSLHLLVISGEVRREFVASRAKFGKAFDKGQFVKMEPLDECDFVIPKQTLRLWSASEFGTPIQAH
jgi:biopolymer transport protein ExbD